MSRGLGPWQESYGVGSKMAPPRMPPDDPQTAFNRVLEQQQAQMNYTQLQMQSQSIAQQAQQMAYMGNMALGGLGIRHYAAISSGDQCERKPYKYRSHKGLHRRYFMQRTTWGLYTRKALEALFWIGSATFVAGWIILPIVIKVGTVLWTWALT